MVNGKVINGVMHCNCIDCCCGDRDCPGKDELEAMRKDDENS